MPFFYSQIFIILLILFSLLIIIKIISIYECKAFIIKHYRVNNYLNSDKIKLIYLSDFHNKNDISYNDKVIKNIIDENADYIVLGGDFVDFSSFNSLFNKVNYTYTLDFIKKLSENFYNSKQLKNYNEKRIFFSFGNHELRLKNKSKDTKLSYTYDNFVEFLKKNNIKILDNEIINLTNGITLSGLSLYEGYYVKAFNKSQIIKNIDIDILDRFYRALPEDSYNILAFHKPDYAEDLLDYKFDLVLSGHNHGGLIRFPFIGSIFSPDLNFMPRYSYGEYTYNNKKLIVSSGIGEHFIKIRVNNRPEICVINII